MTSPLSPRLFNLCLLRVCLNCGIVCGGASVVYIYIYTYICIMFIYIYIYIYIYTHTHIRERPILCLGKAQPKPLFTML